MYYISNYRQRRHSNSRRESQLHIPTRHEQAAVGVLRAEQGQPADVTAAVLRVLLAVRLQGESDIHQRRRVHQETELLAFIHREPVGAGAQCQ